MEKEKQIVLFESAKDVIEVMDGETAKRFILALFDYSINGIEPDKTDIAIYIPWRAYKFSLDKHNEITESNHTRAVNGAKARWSNAKNAQACSSMPKHNQAMLEKEIERESEIEREIESEREKEVNISNARDKSRAGAGGSSDVAKINTIISEFTSDDELKLALHEFVKMRTKIKKPITPYGLQQALKKLRELGSDQTSTMVKVINQSIEKSWQSFYPIDNQRSQAHNEPPKQRTMQERFNAVTELARQKGIIT